MSFGHPSSSPNDLGSDSEKKNRRRVTFVDMPPSASASSASFQSKHEASQSHQGLRRPKSKRARKRGDVHSSVWRDKLQRPRRLRYRELGESTEYIFPAFGAEERTLSFSMALFTLIAAIVGGGALSLPFAVAKEGWCTRSLA